MFIKKPVQNRSATHSSGNQNLKLHFFVRFLLGYEGYIAELTVNLLFVTKFFYYLDLG